MDGVRRLLSFVVTAVTFAAGLGLLAPGAVTLLNWPRSSEPLPPDALALALAGSLLLGLGAFTVRWSSSGLLLIGGLVVVAGALAIGQIDAPTSATLRIVDALNNALPGLGNGLIELTFHGMPVLLGATWFGIGLGARRRPRPRATGALAVACAILALAALIAQQYAAQLTASQPAGSSRQLLVIGAGALFGLLLTPSGSKTIGLWLGGGVSVVVGLVLLFFDGLLEQAPVAYGVARFMGFSGMFAALGVILLGAALGATLRQRAGNHR